MSRLKTWLFVFLLTLSSFPRLTWADFRLTDAIEEFGEQRFLKPLPTRLVAGPLRFHPSLVTQVEYDDNILFEPDDPREDVVYNIQPGTIVEVPFGKHQVAVGYEAEFEIFSKHRHARRQSDQNQNAFALVDLRFPSFYVNLLDQFSETSSRGGTTFSDRIPRMDHNVHPKLGYRWKRATFETSFRHFLRDYRRQIHDSFQFQYVEWSEVFYYDLFARLKALADYQVAQIDYDDDRTRNGTFQQARVGLDGYLLPNLLVKLRTGPHFRNYKVSSEANFNSWVGSLRAEYEPRENWLFKLIFDRLPREATFGDVNYYKEHSISFEAEYRIRRQWTAFSESRYWRHDYGEREDINGRAGFRRDNHVSTKGGLRYSPQEWWELEAAYRYRRRNSNFSAFDYTDNRFTLTSTLKY